MNAIAEAPEVVTHRVSTQEAAAGVRGNPATPAEIPSFRLGSEEYGIDILRVQEIRAYEAGIGIVNTGDAQRMLILMDIEALMSSANMGLLDDPMH